MKNLLKGIRKNRNMKISSDVSYAIEMEVMDEKWSDLKCTLSVELIELAKKFRSRGQ